MTNPEAVAQLEEQKKNCIFCRIISGEMGSKTVFKDDQMIGVLDVNPWTKGHVLVLPKEHYPIMPLIPPQTFRHMFGLMPRLVGAVKSAMLSKGANILIANGGVAGQQSPHFLLHILPRENGDKLDKFGFDEGKGLDKEKLDKAISMLATNVPIMMKNHFARNPVNWRTGKISTAEFLKDIKNTKVIYEDEKVFCIVPENPQVVGHLAVYSQEEESLFEKLDEESSRHMFYTASYCATAVFEGLTAQGSNIILKSGVSMDNPTGRLCIHTLPRYSEDGLDILGTPLEEKPDLDEIASKIKDKTFALEHKPKEKTTTVIDLDKESRIERIGGKEEKKVPVDEKDEISSAIEDIHGI